jgi:hypothetical protein
LFWRWAIIPVGNGHHAIPQIYCDFATGDLLDSSYRTEPPDNLLRLTTSSDGDDVAVPNHDAVLLNLVGVSRSMAGAFAHESDQAPNVMGLDHIGQQWLLGVCRERPCMLYVLFVLHLADTFLCTG